ncbi:MAG TPA: LPS export ABC transporter periplasmic protein LptC [Burkholderiaceae bacterium]|jgi:lipopolysaccharide export system protein LptC
MATLAPAPGRTRARQPFVWRIQALVSSYLPLLLMALMAAASWWLVKNTPLLSGPVETVAPRHEPDYSMQHFELRRMGADGRLRLRVEGNALRHYPDTDTVEIDGVQLRSFGADGGLTVATARRGIGNGDGSQMQLLGDVTVRGFEPGAPETATPRMTVRGDFLQAEADGQKLSSHLPVVVSYPGGEVQAPNFNYEHLGGSLHFGGVAHGQFLMHAKKP